MCLRLYVFNMSYIIKEHLQSHLRQGASELWVFASRYINMSGLRDFVSIELLLRYGVAIVLVSLITQLAKLFYKWIINPIAKPILQIAYIIILTTLTVALTEMDITKSSTNVIIETVNKLILKATQ